MKLYSHFWWDFTFQKVKPSSSSECSTVDIALSEEEEMIYEHEKPKHRKNSKKKVPYTKFLDWKVEFKTLCTCALFTKYSIIQVGS